MLSLPPHERPRERLVRIGTAALTTAELIAILLGSGTQDTSAVQLAQDLIGHFGSVRRLADASVEELCEMRGIGPAKAIALQAAFALGKRVGAASNSPLNLNTPADVYRHLGSLTSKKEEHFLVLLQNAKGGLIGEEIVAIGSVAQVAVHPREVFHPAVRRKASAIIVAHNHPSGDPTPSAQDIALTQRLIAAAHPLAIPLNDHIIVGHQGFTSIREHFLAEGLRWG